MKSAREDLKSIKPEEEVILQPLDKRIPSWDFSRFEERGCPICETENFDSSYIRPDKCSVLRCSNCSCLYVSPAPSEDLINEFYSTYHDTHFGGSTNKIIEDIKSELDRAAPQSDLRIKFLHNDMLVKNSPSYRVLDYGCGTGSFLYQAQRLGASVSGIEIDKSAVLVCHKLGLDSVILGGADALETLDTKYDLIVLNDVIEHPLNPNYLISILSDLLSENGKILIWTPNGNAIDNDDSKTTLRVDLEHMQYLTSGAVAELCRRNNLAVWHYHQLGIPSEKNFISNAAEKSSTSKIKSGLIFCLRMLGLKYVARNLLARLRFKLHSPHQSDGNYHLFCVLIKQNQ